MKSPTALCRENIDSQICRRRVEACFLANIENREALSTLSTVHVRIFKHSATGVLLHTHTHTSMSVYFDDNLWCYSAPLVTLQGGGLWQCCHIFHCPLVTSRLVAAPLYELVRLHQSSNLVIEKTGFSWTSPTVYTHHMYVPVPPLSPWGDVARCHSASSLLWDFLGFGF